MLSVFLLLSILSIELKKWYRYSELFKNNKANYWSVCLKLVVFIRKMVFYIKKKASFHCGSCDIVLSGCYVLIVAISQEEVKLMLCSYMVCLQTC